MAHAAVVGMGNAGNAHAQFYLTCPDAELVAVVDPTFTHYATSLPSFVRRFDSIADLLKANLQLDVVSICTPPNSHSELASAILRKGISCICEKPLTLDSLSAMRMADTLTGAVSLIPVHNYLYSPWWKSLRTRADDLGSVGSLVVRVERRMPSAGVSTWNPEWRTLKEISGGGVLWDMGIHALYLAQDLFVSEPVAVTVLSWRERMGCELKCDVVFGFPDLRSLRFIGDWASRARQTSWTLEGHYTKNRGISSNVGNDKSRWRISEVSPSGTGRWLDGVFEEYLHSRKSNTNWQGSLRAEAVSILALEKAREAASSIGTCVAMELSKLGSAFGCITDVRG